MSIVWDVFVGGEYYCTMFTRMEADERKCKKLAYERACVLCKPLRYISKDRVKLEQNGTTMYSPSAKFDEE